MDDERKYLLEMLAMLQESYEKAAEPYIKHLAAIEAMKKTYIVVTPEQAMQFFDAKDWK